MEGKSSARIYSLDYLRGIACIMVIGIHCMGFVSSDGTSTKYIVINHFVRIGLPIFFLLSSVAVNNRVEYINDLKSYYISKMLSLGIYFLIFSVYYYEYKNQTMSSLNEIVRNIPAGLLATLNGSQYYHLWYIYTFAGLTLWMPFLKVLLKNLKFEQHLILSIGCFLLSIANYYLNIADLVGKDCALGKAYHITTEECIKWEDVLEQHTGKRSEVCWTEKSDPHLEKTNYYQIHCDREYDRRFSNAKIQTDSSEQQAFMETKQGLEKCLTEFLNGERRFQFRDWKEEAVLDRISGDKSLLKEIPGVNNKVKYVVYRYIFNV